MYFIHRKKLLCSSDLLQIHNMKINFDDSSHISKCTYDTEANSGPRQFFHSFYI